MCLKNVNITAIPCLESDENGTSLVGMFDSVKALRNGSENFYLNKLYIFLNMSIVLPIDTAASHENEIKIGDEFDVSVRLTHIATALCTDFARFQLHLEEDKIITACRQFWEFHRIVSAYNFQLNGLGAYAIKILIKKKGETSWVTQAIHRFEVQ